MKTPLEDEIDDILRKAYRGKSADRSIPDNDYIEKLVKQAACEILTDDQIFRAAEILDLNAEKLLKVARHPYFKQSETPSCWQTLIHPFGPYTVNSHLLINKQNKNCILFDTGTREDEIIDFISEHNLTLTDIFITHGHRDHIGGLNKLANNSATTNIHAADTSIHDGTNLIKEDNVYSFDPFQIKAISTPGHATDGISFHITHIHKKKSFIVVGDALFARSVGKIPGNYSKTLNIIQNKILSLPSETIILPGHGGNTTVGSERKRNPFFNC